MSKRKSPHILLVEDDLNLGFLLQEYLESESFDVILCRDGKQGYKAFKEQAFDLCILDVMLPKSDGFSLARQIKQRNEHVPIIFLTAKALKNDKLEGFEIGADDYITKPFDEDELVYRINAILRRTQKLPETNEETSFQIGAYEFDYLNQLLVIGDNSKRLTTKESEVLRLLSLHKNEILRRDAALLAIYGDSDYFNGRSFDVFITKLRKYLKEDPNVKIENIHGVGFKLVDQPS
ncbi:response regulator transcription factor [Rapidithrix thailandica]|uniref:Response regulator transcription factor n=1 Tax=Rapidithrix thailandica TaxID=413964 RepID=A0AAW9SB53_9BACT